jgi:gas vesicle protein
MNTRLSLIFLTGVAMGTAIGLLIAPEPARATLRKVKRDADRLVDKVEQLKEQARE